MTLEDQGCAMKNSQNRVFLNVFGDCPWSIKVCRNVKILNALAN